MTAKKLRFANMSTLHIYEQPDENLDLHYNEKDSIRFEEESVLTISKMNEAILQVPGSVWSKHCISTDSVSEGMVFIVAHRHLSSENNGTNPEVEPEEMIGLEPFLHGSDYFKDINEKKIKTIQFVVNTWRETHVARNEEEREMQLDQDTNEKFIEEKIASIYKSMARKSSLKARRRANCVHWLNGQSQHQEHVSSYSSKSHEDLHEGQSSSAFRRSPLRPRGRIKFIRRSAIAA